MVIPVVKPDRSRYVYVYLPSAEDKQRWQTLADEAGVPLSKFVIAVVESTLAENTEFKPRGEMVKETGQLRSENKALKDELKLKNIVLDKYEGELKRYRSEAFLEDKFDGLRKYNKELVTILKRGGVMDSYKLLSELGIDPGE
ncbi:MAG: hypothetical protein GKC10_09470, partial [Methanosarcinales archaeon]|nr:hypothetical protein [Methanosarcinales archaeon]